MNVMLTIPEWLLWVGGGFVILLAIFGAIAIWAFKDFKMF